jgi:biotin-dependent carboxylase-like uncharacterized protein
VIEIESASALASVQDLGRRGALHWGVGTSGAMDDMSLMAGNLLLGNAETDAAVELQVFPYQVRFLDDCAFALTGADTAARLDDDPVLPWWRCAARAGQILRLGLPQRNSWPACRTYLCLAGGVAVPMVLGSRSTQLRGAFGGYQGRTLRAGDRLPVGRTGLTPDDEPGFGLTPPALAMPLEVDGSVAVRVLPASEYPLYTAASQDAFWTCPWRISSQSDRYGYRLTGEHLRPCAPIEMRSHGIVPGVIQVPPGGQPIIQMRDAQPSGGYPKIGTVIEPDLWRLGQAPIGSRIRFVRVDWDQAVRAQHANRRWLDEAARLVGLWRDRPQGRK